MISCDRTLPILQQYCYNIINIHNLRKLTMNIEEKAIETIKTFPPEKQQEILNFMEFLKSKMSPVEVNNQATNSPVSALELAGKLVGCLDDEPADISTNKKYLEDYGL